MILRDLENYARFWDAGTNPEFNRYREFVTSTPECCERTHLAGHCTGSAFIVNPKADKVLLLFHPFLKRWLQPGGHADGSSDLLDVAKRETHEETGLPMEALRTWPKEGADRIPLDLDIHTIPERKQEPLHSHYDLRFLLVADPEWPLTQESPDMTLEWLDLQDIGRKTDEESVLRMARKVRDLPRDAAGYLSFNSL